MSVFEELKRRNVFRVGAAYAVASWVLIQVIDVVTPIFDIPDWAPRLIFVILAVGLVPALVFAWAFEITPEGIKRERDIDRDQSVTHQTAKKLDLVTIGLLVLVVVFVFVERGMQPNNGSAPAAAAEVSDKSIAVLAFEDLSQDGDQGYFADGLSEELLNLLAQVPDLQVAGRTSSFAFKGQHRDLREIGEILNVAHVLEGSVRKAGNNIRVTAQLVSTKDGFHLFSETYDDELSDIFKVQDDIAEQITAALKAELIGAEAVVEVPVTDVRAYELYLEARQKIHTRDGVQLQEASSLLDAALVIDPNYAPALAQKAMALALLSNAPGSYGDIPFEVAYSQAETLLEKALELSPDLAEAHAVLGLIQPTGSGNAKALHHLQRAVEINPTLDDANLWLATLLGQLGREDEETALLEQVVERDPLFPPAIGNLVSDYVNRRDFDKATALMNRYERASGKDSTVNTMRGHLAVAQGDYAAAARHYRAALDLDPSSTILRNRYGQVMRSLGEFETLREMNLAHFEALYTAFAEGTYDEAALEAAYPRAADVRFFGFHIFMYAVTGELDKTLQAVDQDYGGLDALLANYPLTDGGGYATYLAYAYRELDMMREYGKVMQAYRESLDEQQSAQNNLLGLWYGEASYAALRGDIDELAAALQEVIDLGDVDVSPMITPEFAPYRNEPRLQPLLDVLRSRGDAARAELGMPPYEPLLDQG